MFYGQFFYGIIKYVCWLEPLPINVSLAYLSMEMFLNRAFLSYRAKGMQGRGREQGYCFVWNILLNYRQFGT